MLDEDLPVKIFKILILDSHSNAGDGDGDDRVFPQPLLPDDGDQPKPRHLGGRGGGGGEEGGESQRFFFSI